MFLGNLVDPESNDFSPLIMKNHQFLSVPNQEQAENQGSRDQSFEEQHTQNIKVSMLNIKVSGDQSL